MKKKIVSAIIIAIMLSLAACDKKTAMSEEARPADTEKTVPDEPQSEFVEVEETEKEEIIDLDKEVVFSDEYLAKEAEQKASSLTVRGLQEITDLDLNYDKITIPEELAYFTNLQSIEMSATSSGDVSWLSYFPDLKYLELDYNHIDNIDEIGNCNNLVSLEIESYNITDISFLEKLTSLEELSIDTDALQDFSPISNLTNLSVLGLYPSTAERLNIDFSGLTNLKIASIMGSITDYTSLSSLNIYDEPTYTDDAGYWTEDYKRIILPSANPLTAGYRDNYSIDKRPENEYFRYIEIQTSNGVTDDTIKTIADINYKYLQSLNFHIDKYYRLVDVPQIEGSKRDIYQEAWDSLVAVNGDPLLKNEAITVTSLSDLENLDNPKIYLDGRYIGLYCPLEDMVAGYTVDDGVDALDYINSVYVNAGGYKYISLLSGSEGIFTVEVINKDESLAKPISECEVKEIKVNRNTNIELRLPQGNETKEYVSWDYPYSSFTDIYENCYHDGYNGDFDMRSYYIFCNDKCDMIEIQIRQKRLDSIWLKRREPDKAEELKNQLTK